MNKKYRIILIGIVLIGLAVYYMNYIGEQDIHKWKEASIEEKRLIAAYIIKYDVLINKEKSTVLKLLGNDYCFIAHYGENTFAYSIGQQGFLFPTDEYLIVEMEDNKVVNLGVTTDEWCYNRDG